MPTAMANTLSHGASKLPECRHRPHPRLSQQRPRPAVIICQATSTSTSSNGTKEPTYRVLITGSTRGVGRALAEEFLKYGDKVVITSKTADLVRSTTDELSQKFGADRVVGLAANVSVGSEVRQLAEFAKDQFGAVDIWINNAGSNAYKYEMLSDSEDDDLVQIVQTNVLGTMIACREAIRIMRDQPNGGHIFNMDGAGANGSPTPRFAAYGSTKRGLQQFGKSLQAELKMMKVNNVGVHNLSPGMVTTDLLMSGANTSTAKFFINCLAEPPEVVAEYLVPRVRKVPQESRTLTGGINSTYIQYLTPPKAYSQILQRVVTGARKGRFVSEE